MPVSLCGSSDSVDGMPMSGGSMRSFWIATALSVAAVALFVGEMLHV